MPEPVKPDPRQPVPEGGEIEPQLNIPLTAEELDWVEHAASLRHLPVVEYVRRAINLSLTKEGVDAVLLSESEGEYSEVEQDCRGCMGPCGRCHEQAGSVSVSASAEPAGERSSQPVTAKEETLSATVERMRAIGGIPDNVVDQLQCIRHCGGDHTTAGPDHEHDCPLFQATESRQPVTCGCGHVHVCTQPVTSASIEEAKDKVLRCLDTAFWGRTDAQAAKQWEQAVADLDALITAVRQDEHEKHGEIVIAYEGEGIAPDDVTDGYSYSAEVVRRKIAAVRQGQ